MKSEATLPNRLRAQLRAGRIRAARATLEEYQSQAPEALAGLATKAVGWAVRSGKPQSLALALEPQWGANANVFLKTMVPSFLHLLIEEASTWLPTDTRLQAAPAMARMLVEAGCRVEHCNWSHQPLKEAVTGNQMGLVKALLELGADPNGLYRWNQGGRGAHSLPPLAYASTLEMVAVLVAAGARAGAAGPGDRCGALLHLGRTIRFQGQLDALLETWRANGGQWDEPMEGSRPEDTTTLPRYVFCTAMEPACLLSTLPRLEEMEREHRALAQEFQLAMVRSGFDLEQLAADGRPYRQHALENGHPDLVKFLVLDALPGMSLPRHAPRM